VADDIRPGEVRIEAPPPADAVLRFIGRIRTPWTKRADCPRRGDPEDGLVCRIEVAEPWAAALTGIERHEWLELLYWMHEARRDLVLQSPRSGNGPVGTFTLRSPVRPNPIATSRVRLVGVEGACLLVRGLDCLDGTPLLDIKPDLPPRA
jgi:tRNA-Thr(GGU) m(6)t(6)A37 methyltransferase TsaA